MLTEKTFKATLAKHPYFGILRQGENPHPGPFVGHFLNEILPEALKSTAATAAPSERFVVMAAGFEQAWPFYPMSHPQSTLLHVAADRRAFDHLRYYKPTKTVSYVRQGDPSNYLAFLTTDGGHLYPLLNYFYCSTAAALDAAYENMKLLLENRRIGVIIAPSARITAAFRSRVKSALRATVTLKQAGVIIPPAAWLEASDFGKLHSEPHAAPPAATFGFKDVSLLFFGTGTKHKSFELSDPTFTAMPQWKAAFTHVSKFVVDATLPTKTVTDHIAAVSAHIEKLGLLVPHLNEYPKPPVFSSLGAVTLDIRLRTKTDPLTDALLRYDNETLDMFNPVVGRPTGIVDAMLSRPTLLSRSIIDTQSIMARMGYRMELSPDQIARLDARRRFYDLQISPLAPLNGLECLAYFTPGRNTSKRTIFNPETGVAVWTKGKEYNLTPNWRKETYPGGSEPVVDELGAVVGVEEFSIRYSVLALEVETNQSTVEIAENACREMLKEDKPEETDAPAEAKPWQPLLDEFLQAFDVPKVPTTLDLRPEEFKRKRAILLERMPHLKAYQADIAVLNALKRGGILGSEMGAGKTFQAIGIMFLHQKAFNLIVVPPMLVPQWLKALHDCRFWARTLLTHEAVNKLQRHFKRLQGLCPAEKRKKMFAEQEFYITTPEFLSLGGVGNKVYDPWTASFPHVLPKMKKHTRLQLDIQGTRYHVGTEVYNLDLANHQTHQYGGIVKECPKCKRDRGAGFSQSGVCQCGYRAFSFKGNRRRLDACGRSATNWIFGDDSIAPNFTESREREKDISATYHEYEQTLTDRGVVTETVDNGIKEIPDVQQKQTSDYCAPAYKRLGKVFGMKVIDEVHLIANLDSQKGAAVYAIPADETFVMSGTISRGYVTDIESALAHVHEPETPCFPFAPWNRKAFKEQFITERVKTTTMASGGDIKVKKSSTMVPEASNVNRLRRMLNCVTTRVDEAVIEAEWKLPPPTRRYIAVTLKPENEAYYNEVLRGVAHWYKYASKSDRQRSAMSKLWELRHICENEEKLEIIRRYVRQWVSEGRKFVVVAPTKFMYQLVRDMLYSYGLRVIAIDDSTAPERRQEITSLFADSQWQGLVSRTKLVCTGLNTLVHADRLIIAGGEYHPSTVRQMEKRLIRPGQKNDRVEIIYPIVRMARPSVEEEMLKLLLLKEASVNEVVKGKVRWIQPAMLVESAMESKGAARVLEALADDKSTKIGDMDLDHIFRELDDTPPVAAITMSLDELSEVAPSPEPELGSDGPVFQPVVSLE